MAKSKKDIDTEWPEIRIKYHNTDPTYLKIIKKAKSEERSPAKEVRLFLKRKFK